MWIDSALGLSGYRADAGSILLSLRDISETGYISHANIVLSRQVRVIDTDHVKAKFLGCIVKGAGRWTSFIGSGQINKQEISAGDGGRRVIRILVVVGQELDARATRAPFATCDSLVLKNKGSRSPARVASTILRPLSPAISFETR
jgi:hypothetical protein